MGRVFACGFYLYLEKTGELDKEKLWHETPEETERHWQQVNLSGFFVVFHPAHTVTPPAEERQVQQVMSRHMQQHWYGLQSVFH